jgi:Fe-S oxidoreductase
MAKLKSEFLALYQKTHGISPRDWLFAHAALLNVMGSLLPGLTNRVLSSQTIRRLMEKLLGIDHRRPFPPLAKQAFQAWFHKRKETLTRSRQTTPRGPVVLWDDIYLSHNEPEVGQAAVKVLERAGFEVRLVTGRRCDGRPQISKGLLEEARHNARHNVALLDPYALRSIPIIGLEPSSLAAFRDEYPGLLGTDAARRVSQQAVMIDEFLARMVDADELDLPFKPARNACRMLVHGHCHQKAVTGTGALLRTLRLIPNAVVEEIPSGCCGMAGSFGFEREHYEISMAMGEDRLFPAVRSAAPDTLIVAPGFSCRHHIAHGTGRKTLHPIVVLADALEDHRL